MSVERFVKLRGEGFLWDTGEDEGLTMLRADIDWGPKGEELVLSLNGNSIVLERPAAEELQRFLVKQLAVWRSA